MNCPRCGAHSYVLETRRGEYMTTRRRRQCANRHVFVSVEMHEPAYCSAKQRLAQFAATTRERIELWKRDVRIAAQLHIGWRELAERYQLTKTAVYLAARRGREHLKERT